MKRDENALEAGAGAGEGGTGAEAAAAVAGAVAAGAWETADRAMDALAEEIVEALIERRDGDVEAMARLVERAYAGLVAGDADAPLVDARVATGQLRAVTALLAVALRHRATDGAPADERDRAILDALPPAGSWLTLVELAEKTGMGREELAGRLPRLRAAGLAASRKAGRTTLHGRPDRIAVGRGRPSA
jgi:DNA-binding transcriptional ArsR family regulator